MNSTIKLSRTEYRAVCAALDEPLTEDMIRVLVEVCGVPSKHAEFFTREEAAAWVGRELGRCRSRPMGARPGRGYGEYRGALVALRAV